MKRLHAKSATAERASATIARLERKLQQVDPHGRLNSLWARLSHCRDEYRNRNYLQAEREARQLLGDL